MIVHPPFKCCICLFPSEKFVLSFVVETIQETVQKLM